MNVRERVWSEDFDYALTVTLKILGLAALLMLVGLFIKIWQVSNTKVTAKPVRNAFENTVHFVNRLLFGCPCENAVKF